MWIRFDLGKAALLRRARPQAEGYPADLGSSEPESLGSDIGPKDRDLADSSAGRVALQKLAGGACWWNRGQASASRVEAS